MYITDHPFRPNIILGRCDRLTIYSRPAVQIHPTWTASVRRCRGSLRGLGGRWIQVGTRFGGRFFTLQMGLLHAEKV